MLKSRDWQRPKDKKERPAGLTLIVWSDDAKHSRRLQLSWLAIGLLVAVVLGITVTIGGLLWRSNELAAQLEQAQQRSQMDSQREQTLHQVVGKQQQTLDSTRSELDTERRKLNALQSQLGDLEQRIGELEQFSEQVRTLIGGQTQPVNNAEGGQPDTNQPSPTPESRLLELADPGNESGYRAVFASYQDEILADSRRLNQTRDNLENLQAVYLDHTSEQQADDAKNQTASAIEAERQAQAREQERQKAAADAAAEAARQAAYNATPHGLPYYGEFSSYFGWRLSPWHPGKREFHPGLDIVADVGTPVQATGGGIVITAERDAGYGKYIRIRHSNGLVTLYGHNSRLLVSVGDYVAKGDIIAYSGNTGASTGPHIHYGIYRDGEAVNPLKYR